MLVHILKIETIPEVLPYRSAYRILGESSNIFWMFFCTYQPTAHPLPKIPIFLHITGSEHVVHELAGQSWNKSLRQASRAKIKPTTTINTLQANSCTQLLPIITIKLWHPTTESCWPESVITQANKMAGFRVKSGYSPRQSKCKILFPTTQKTLTHPAIT